jgi:hypothetical protein
LIYPHRCAGFRAAELLRYHSLRIAVTRAFGTFLSSFSASLSYSPPPPCAFLSPSHSIFFFPSKSGQSSSLSRQVFRTPTSPISKPQTPNINSNNKTLLSQPKCDSVCSRYSCSRHLLRRRHQPFAIGLGAFGPRFEVSALN